MSSRIQSTPGTGIYLALMLLMLPIQWVLALIFAVLVHEGMHMIAIFLCSKQLPAIHLYVTGAQIHMPPISRKQEFFCALAGPLGSLLLLLTAGFMPRTALCAAVQCLWNLLPVYPLDGGRALSCLLSMLLPPPKARMVQIEVERITIAGIVLLSIYCCFGLELGFIPVILPLMLYLRRKNGKMLAKRKDNEYNSVIPNR